MDSRFHSGGPHAPAFQGPSLYRGPRPPGVQVPALYDGQRRLERFRRYIDERGYQYAEDWFTYNASVGALAAGATAVAQINIERDSTFECLMITGGANEVATTGFSAKEPVEITIIDSASSRNLMNAAIPMFNLAGTGENPFILPIPRRFMAQTQVSVVFHNYSAATAITGASISLIGRKIYKANLPGMIDAPPLERFVHWHDQETGQWYSEDLYTYDCTLASLASTVSTAVDTLTEADSDFEWVMTTFSALDNNGAVKSARDLNVALQIKDGGSQRNLLNQSTPAQQIAGTGDFPFVLRQPRIVLAKTSVNVTFTNNTAVTLTKLHLSLCGRKIFELD